MSSFCPSSSTSRTTTSSNSNSNNNNKNNKRPRRGCVYELAQSLTQGEKAVVICGAGLSVASGIPLFRGKGGVWTSRTWEMNTRASFRKSPLHWYRDFWIPLFCSNTKPHQQREQQQQPNPGHAALETLLDLCGESLTVISQNIDGLLDTKNSNRVIEAHGRLGYYKCIPPEDSDTDSDDDEDDDRLVHLGHRRKSRALRRGLVEKSAEQHDDVGHIQVRIPCKYEFLESIPLHQVQPPSVRDALEGGGVGVGELTTTPTCPECKSPIAPQTLLFDEGYHSHSFYQFERMEHVIEQCRILIFVGTSFHVRLSQIALQHARSCGLQVYNFNTLDVLEPTSILNVHNVVGPCEETLVRLVEACLELQNNESSKE
jgi:NAD-dependent SIR2 family protein deacetylase